MAPRTRSMVISDDSEPLTMAFAQLDDDLLYLCVESMPPVDLARVRLVSRKFQSVASQDHLWASPLADLEKKMPLPQKESWTPSDLATWSRCFPQLIELMRDDDDFKDPRLDPKSMEASLMISSSSVAKYGALSSVAKYGALRAYDKRVTARLEQFGKNSSWTVHDRRLLRRKADEFQRYDWQWERVAMYAGENDGDYGEGLYDYLLDAQEQITPEMCGKAVAVIAHTNYKARKLHRGFRILLVGGPAACDLYAPTDTFRLAVTVSKLI